MEENNKELISKLSIQNDRLTVVKFEADWCSSCKAMVPAIKKLAEQTPEVTYISVDVENPEYNSLALGLGVRSLPTFAFYKDGKMLSIEKGLNQLTLKKKVESLMN